MTTNRTLSAGLAAALILGGSVLAAAPATAAAPVASAVSASDPLPAGTVTITGTPELGSTLTAATAGWPEGTTFTYEWYFSGGQFGGAIDGEVDSTYVVDADIIGLWIGVFVTGTNPDYSGTQDAQFLLTTVASAPQKPTATAPVTDSSGLPSYLESKDATVEAPEFAGLPGAGVTQGAPRSAALPWGSGDSFVDVYLYSSPVVVGTFPVVDGVAQITLSAAVLDAVGTGPHTLVAVGQTSGGVQAVSLQVTPGLAATGSTIDIALVAGAGLLLLAGLGLAMRRRQAA